ncbi:MAG TPA: PfkB family carbohydrate kinase [Bryobacteraceae bacterium]|nr:PfkB family carbohydrate kinase [Bryobacteraceae bacterium]
MTPSEILERIRSLSVLVVGDVCLDRWCTYDPQTSEPSRETGLPRTGVVRTEVTAGAAGTVANNLVALGSHKVAVIGVAGDDGHGYELRRELQMRGIESGLLVTVANRQTFTYTKLINGRIGEEDLPRIDFISTQPLEAEAEDVIASSIAAQVPNYDVVIVSDQAETDQGGVVTPKVRGAVAEMAAAYPNKVFWVDSRRRIQHFRGMVLKPNAAEADAACEELFGRRDYPALRRHTDARPLLVTHGGDGVLLVEEHGEEWIGTRKVEKPVDICGAGDSFSAGGALALAACGSIRTAISFGNLVASVTIMKKGTGTASPQEVLAAAGLTVA